MYKNNYISTPFYIFRVWYRIDFMSENERFPFYIKVVTNFLSILPRCDFPSSDFLRLFLSIFKSLFNIVTLYQYVQYGATSRCYHIITSVLWKIKFDSDAART